MPPSRGRNLTLNQYLGSVKDNLDKIQYLEPTTLKKGRIVQSAVILYSDLFSKCRFAYILGVNKYLFGYCGGKNAMNAGT